MNSFEITDSEFKKLSEYIFNHFGIFLAETKKGLVISRLQKILRKMNFASFTDYYDYLLKDQTGSALDTLINQISTNYTFFNREEAHFNYLTQTALPEICTALKKQNSHDIRIWSAGCASGEEAYMLVILLKEFLAREYNLWDAGVLATDISQNALDFANKAIYPEDRLSKMPKKYLNKYFTKTPDGNFAVNEEVKKEVTFRRFNLMNETFPFKKPFHIIFCRNVMIYFNTQTRNELVAKFNKNLISKGYLFIGHSETLGKDPVNYNYIMPALYQKSN